MSESSGSQRVCLVADEAVLVEARDGHETRANAKALDAILADVATLPDYGLKLVPTPDGGHAFESRSVLIDERVREAAHRAYPDANVVYAYLANTVRDLDTSAEFPYSMVAGLRTLDGDGIPPGTIVLNRWAADEFRSVNGQIEYLLQRAVDQRRKERKRVRRKKPD